MRKKAVCSLHRLHQLDRSCLLDHTDKIRRALCDKGKTYYNTSLSFLIYVYVAGVDPSVMGASLVLLQALIAEDTQVMLPPIRLSSQIT